MVLLHGCDHMAVSIEAIGAVEVDGLEIHAEAHPGGIYCPCAAAATINNGVDLYFAVEHRSPLIAASAAAKVVAGYEVARTLQELRRHPVEAELCQHRLRFVVRVIDGIRGIRLNKGKGIVVIRKVSANGNSDLSKIVHAGDAASALDHSLVFGQEQRGKDCSYGDD